MALIKNPFSREKTDDQLTADLLRPEKETKPDIKTIEDLEKKKEMAQEKVEKQAKEKLTAIEKDIPSHSPATPSDDDLTTAKSINLQKVEKVMEEGLEEIYFNMDEAHRALFKAEGERTAREIDRIIATGKSVAVKVLEAIKRWLRLVPGVNKFFIEQEAKIKTDKIFKATGENNK